MSEIFTVPNKRYVKYVPVGYVDTHHLGLAYLFWLIGFLGAHRFYLGRPISGAIWFFTFGLLGIGWLVDLALIPGMVSANNRRYQMGWADFNIAWVLFFFLGVAGAHRFYQGKWLTGLFFLFTLGGFGIGWLYDLLTLNDQIHLANATGQPVWPIYSDKSPVWS